MDEKKYKKFWVSLSSRDVIEPEEIFFDSEQIKRFEEEEEIEAGKLEQPIAPRVFSLLEVIEFGVIVFLGGFSAFLVLAKGEEYKLQAEANTLRAISLVAERGLIYAARGEILAQNEIYFDIYLQAAKLPSNEELYVLSKHIGDVLGEADMLYEKFINAKDKKFSEFVFLRGASKEEVARLDEIIYPYDFFEIRQAPRRKYVEDTSFSHILGYTGEVSAYEVDTGKYKRGERVGKMGAELFYDDFLKGKPGILLKIVNSRGEVFSQEVHESPKSGEDITLHINAQLQRKVHEILKKHIKELHVSAGTVILLDPRNGGVKSIVSVPNFDANLFESGIEQKKFAALLNDPSKPLFMRSIGGEYPTGSTIKPIIAAAALEEKVVTPEFLVYSGGAISVPSVYDSSVFYEFKDWKAHGWTDLRKAIADSVNIYFYTISGGYKDKEGLGARKIGEYLEKFGWGEQLGIDLAGEASGLIPTPKWKKARKGENWYIGDTYLMSIGQGGILATPLQIAASTMVFANNGVLFAPRVAAKIGSKTIDPKIIRKEFVSSENFKVVREGMRRAVEKGSSIYLSTLPYAVAGKTGTAQTGREKNHAWFTGFAPYENPEVVITILIEEGDESNYAVRLARDILEAYFSGYPQTARD